MLLSSLLALLSLIAVATLAWMFSFWKKDVSIVDSLWSLFFLLATVFYAGWVSADIVNVDGLILARNSLSDRGGLVLLLVMIWSIRLSFYITKRNWGKGEDRRYQAIRDRNQPNFDIKSLYLIFWLQALLAWLIAMPLMSAVFSRNSLNWLDLLGITLWIIGFTFEALGDAQLAHFKSQASNRGKVMSSGLWRYTRHPNYFGECVLWWGYFCFALASGWQQGWTVISVILMTFLLLKVSGVALLEADLLERRPGYRDYVQKTSAFFPWWPKKIES